VRIRRQTAAADFLTEAAEVLYKTTDYYSPSGERCIVWNDPDLAIEWPLAAEPVVSKRRHEWTALWETLPDTSPGTYRLVATGRAQLNGVVQPYRLQSRAFTLGPSTAIASIAARSLVDGRVLVTARYEPNPMRFERGDPVANFRLRDLTARPDLGMPARGGSLMVEAKLGMSGLMLAGAWSDVDQGYLVTIPTNTGGSWELTVARGALVDALGNSNGAVLSARFDR
jgi:hypothetical protein